MITSLSVSVCGFSSDTKFSVLGGPSWVHVPKIMLHTRVLPALLGSSPCRNTDWLLISQICWHSNRLERILRLEDIPRSQSFENSFRDPR